MRRRPLASAFVTTVVSSGCAWSYGGALQYTQATDGHAAFSGNVRGAWGIGGESSLSVFSELGLGVNPARPTLWANGAAGLQWTTLPRQGAFGWRAGVGTFIGAPRTEHDMIIAPALRGELLYGFAFTEDVYRGLRATSLAFGLTAAYDVTDPVMGPVFALTVSVVRDGAVPFGNPPPPRVPPGALQTAPTTQNVMATDPTPTR